MIPPKFRKVPGFVSYSLRRPRRVAMVYFGAIPIFALAYWLCADAFYQTTSSIEAGSFRVTKETQTVLLQVANDWFSLIREEGVGGKSFTFQSVSIAGLASSEQSLSFDTPFSWSLPFSRSRSVYKPRWELGFPPNEGLHHSADPNTVELSLRITSLPRSVALMLSKSFPQNTWGDQHWGPLWGHVIQSTGGDVDNNVFDGFMIISKKSYEIIERYRSAHLGSPAALEGGFLRFLYLSAVTITTLGYGDIVPLTNVARGLVAIESICGIILAGLFLNSLKYDRTSP